VETFTAHVTVAAPREALFGYLADVSSLPEFCDHFIEDVRLLREDSLGRGAGIRFKLKGARFNRFPWADLTWVEVEAPRKLVGAGRMGKFNRIRVLYEVLLEPSSGGATRLQWSVTTFPKTPTDRLIEAVGTAARLRKGWGKALKRLASFHDEGGRRGARATIAGGPRKPATGTPLHPLARR
jgi:uncharacterized protein YndB with AHSA1/START domain